MNIRVSSQSLALGSFGVALLVLGLKLVAWRVTGSVALYSDAVESLVNVAGAVLAWIAIRIADQPADHDHPFGHHKAENFSAIAEGSLIVVAAFLIIHQAVDALLSPGIQHLGPVGLGVSVLAMGINLVWARFLIRAGAARR
ncbi:MAG: cation diffusion facilitator family transporter, partial [Pseudomonadota bacterium]